MIRGKILYGLLSLCLFSSIAFANFNGPVTVLTTTYGSADGQLGVSLEDSDDRFPWKFAVSPSGRIAICDEVNRRVAIYKSNGSFEKNINRLSTSVVFDNNDFLYLKAKFRKYDSNGNMIFEKNIGFNEISITLNDVVIGFDKKQKSYALYTSNGDLIKTTKERPFELGQIKSVKLDENKYKITITYPDKVYGLASDREFVKYVRTSIDKVYGVNPGGAWRFNQCGKLEGFLLMREGQQDEVPGQGREEPQVYVHSEYGEPVVAPNGNVYTWKRTPDKYSILKWTWVDDPNVPKDCSGNAK